MARGPIDEVRGANRKAVPHTNREWSREVAGIVSFCAQKPHLTDANGKAWFTSMVNYYRARLAVLAANVPPGMSKTQAREMLSGARKALD